MVVIDARVDHSDDNALARHNIIAAKVAPDILDAKPREMRLAGDLGFRRLDLHALAGVLPDEIRLCRENTLVLIHRIDQRPDIVRLHRRLVKDLIRGLALDRLRLIGLAVKDIRNVFQAKILCKFAVVVEIESAAAFDAVIDNGENYLVLLVVDALAVFLLGFKVANRVVGVAFLGRRRFNTLLQNLGRSFAHFVRACRDRCHIERHQHRRKNRRRSLEILFHSDTSCFIRTWKQSGRSCQNNYTSFVLCCIITVKVFITILHLFMLNVKACDCESIFREM